MECESFLIIKTSELKRPVFDLMTLLCSDTPPVFLIIYDEGASMYRSRGAKLASFLEQTVRWCDVCGSVTPRSPLVPISVARKRCETATLTAASQERLNSHLFTGNRNFTAGQNGNCRINYLLLLSLHSRCLKHVCGNSHSAGLKTLHKN